MQFNAEATFLSEVDAADLPPWKVQWVPVGDNLDDLAVHGDGVVTDCLDIGIKDTEHGIVLQQVGGLLDTSGVVDDDDLQGRVLPSVPASDEVASDSSKSVDGNLHLSLDDGSLLGTADGLVGE